MATIQRSFRIKEPILREIERIRKDKPANALANELLEEALKMRRCPGIIFSQGVTGRRARIAGTGVEVWEVIYEYQIVGEDVKALKKALPHLTEKQLIAALNYYRSDPEEIDELIQSNDAITPKSVEGRFSLPKRKGR
ncbi:MAG TPA: DUF433 domain-containing protein [Thermodesulfovibrionales bacterium]|jgi:uncharacterized protein (DUF433 family)|nr:DUF433 domain-containing protein [Thermodesulfovibrionales bacterium]